MILALVADSSPAGILWLVIASLAAALIALANLRRVLRDRRNPKPPVAASRQSSVQPRDTTPYDHPGFRAGLPDDPEEPQ